jgi:hypothetical protein
MSELPRGSGLSEVPGKPKIGGNMLHRSQVYIINRPESTRLNLMGRMDSGLKQASTLPQARAR